MFVSSGLARRLPMCCWCSPRAPRLSAYIGATVGEIGFLRGIWMDGSRRLAWLEDYAASLAAHGGPAAPDTLHDGIRLEHVSFAYPGTTHLVLDDVIAADARRLGRRDRGRERRRQEHAGEAAREDVRTDVRRASSRTRRRSRASPAAEWRARLAGAFQDFFRFEFLARHTVGVGDVPRIDDEPAVIAAVGRAGADDVVVRLKAGLDTQLGPTWPGGVEVSFGQWQKLALARGFMRDEPLLLVLDEPTAALDAETEHALFERYAAAARDGGRPPAASRFWSRTASRRCAWPI